MNTVDVELERARAQAVSYRDQRDKLLGDLNVARQEIARLTALTERKVPAGVAALRDRLAEAARDLEDASAANAVGDYARSRILRSIAAVTDAVRVLYTIEEGQR